MFSFIDNAGTMAGFAKGPSASAKQNIMIGESWMEFAGSRIAIQFWRVASKCNCADVPSRLDFCFMQKLGARFVEPVQVSLEDLGRCAEARSIK